jgi:hypothetical protein
MRKRLTAVALAGTVGLGAVGATAVAYPALADNSKKESPQAGSDAAQKARTAAIRAALNGLVDDKTLTADQADKVASTLAGSDTLPGPGKFGGFGGGGMRPGGGLLGVEGPEADAAAAKVLGMSVDDLRTALSSGSTLADLAKKQGKDVDTLVNALVATAKQRLADGVKAGKISQETATQIEKTLEQRVRDVVQNGRPALGGMGRWHDKGGPAGPRPSPPPSSGSATAVPTPSELFPNGRRARPGPAPSTSGTSTSFGTA